MKTIEYKGKVYQVGAIYEFSDGGKAWFVDTLKDVYQDGYIYTYKTRSGINFKFIRACEAKTGTVEDAPTELIDGECYQFTDCYGMERKGYFVAEYDRLYYFHCGADPSKCTNIKLLVVGE